MSKLEFVDSGSGNQRASVRENCLWDWRLFDEDPSGYANAMLDEIVRLDHRNGGARSPRIYPWGGFKLGEIKPLTDKALEIG